MNRPLNRPRRKRTAPGFTLVEVLVTMTLISMMCLGVFAGMQQITQAMMAIAVRDEAYHLMQERAELLLSGDYSSFTATAADETVTSSFKTSFVASTAAALAVPVDNGSGRITFTRRVVNVTSTANSKTLRAEVQWQFPKGRTNTVSIPLYRTQ